MDNNQFYAQYYKERLHEALRGDSGAAKDLLLHIETALAGGTQINPAAAIYLRYAINRIFEGDNPAQALLLIVPHRKKGKQEIDHLVLAAAYQHLLNQGVEPTEAKNTITLKYGPVGRTIERAHANYRTCLEFLNDNELVAIYSDK